MTEHLYSSNVNNDIENSIKNSLIDHNNTKNTVYVDSDKFIKTVCKNLLLCFCYICICAIVIMLFILIMSK